MKKRQNLMGCPVDPLTMKETISLAETYIKNKELCQHVVVNVSKFMAMQKNDALQKIISDCNIINADGMPLVWASKLLGEPLPCRVAGVDLFQNLIALCSHRGYRPFFFGAKPWVVEKVVTVYQKQYPSLEVAGFRNGYFNPGEEGDIAEIIRKSQADMLFVGFSSPMKEHFLNTWMSQMQVPFCMGVGGSFDIIAGKTRRAPDWMQQCGLEWLYRVIQEPRRMWKRYAKTNPVFIWLVLKALVKKDVHRLL